MPKFRKLQGRHSRTEEGVKVTYKPGDVIEATEEELRKHDPKLETWIRLTSPSTVEEDVVEKPATASVSLQVTSIKGTKLFNVINTATNEPINDEPLSRKDAFSLVKMKQTEIETEKENEQSE